MTGPDLALLLTVLAMLGLRGAGLLLGGVLRPDHPVIAWAAAVSMATLSAFVVLAVAVPSGLLATVPWPARLAGVAVGALAWRLARGGLLVPLLAGVGAVLAVSVLIR
jgi:hypothetical protein